MVVCAHELVDGRWERRMSGASFGGYEWWLKLTCGLGQDCEVVETWSEGKRSS